MRRSKSLVGMALVLLALGMLLTACGAEQEIRQGDVGEFCNGRDDDCREGLACVDGVCDTLGPKPVYSCEEMCQKLDDCDAGEAGCVTDCRATIADWSLDAKNSFATCVVEDVTCEEAQENFVPQLCYSRLPLPADRQERCDSFVDTARTCNGSVDVDPLLEACYRLGRTGDEDDWAATDRCVSAQETGICSGIATCFNDVFGISIDLGDGDLPLNDIVVER